MRELIICRCGYRNHKDGKFCVKCEAKLYPVSQQPVRAHETVDQYAKRCGPVFVRVPE